MQGKVETDTVIRHIYEASYRPAHWATALEFIVKYTHSNSAALFYTDNEAEHLSCSYTYNVSENLAQTCDCCGTDPSFNILAKHIPVGTAAAVDHIVTNREELESSYGDEFNDFLKAADMYHIGGSILFMDKSCTSGICLQRTKSMGPWTREQIDTLNILIPHLQHAMTINKEFAQLQSREQALRKGMDRLFMGLILFDKELNPIYINPVAKSIFSYHPAISLNNNKISTNNKSQTKKIYTALESALISTPDADPAESSTAIGLRHRDHATILPMIISHVSGVLHGFETGGHHAHVAMYFSDPDRTYPINANQLVDIYDLTPAEAQVAISMANGITPEEIAKLKDVTISTIRSQLKAIYQKLGINSQVELVKTLLTGPSGQSL